MSSVDTLLENKELEEMLEFETQIFLDVLHNDGLVVAAKGLCLNNVLLNVFKVYCDPGNLVLVLNCMEYEENYFVEKLHDENVHRTTFTTNTTEREDVYLSGGIHFITTRILVVDMLKKRVPIEKITGFVVLRAHSVLESCQEAFVLRLFRQHNKVGFIKAFSNSAQSFTSGFGHIERVMRTLFLKELYIWPRFHTVVIQSLKKHEPLVVELHVPLSKTIAKIQTCLLDLMNLTVKDLKRINKTVELQEITVENCLTKKFHKILQLQLDCVWHQLSTKSKQLIADLKTLRHLICLMLYADPVTFYATLSSYRTAEYAQTAMWVLLEPAELLFSHANSLVYSTNKELNPELCPKWKALSELLREEIPAEMKKLNGAESKVLVLCQDSRTCFQLNHFLMHGPHNYLFIMSLKYGIQFKSVSSSFKNCKGLNSEDTSKSAKKQKVEENTDDPNEDLENLRSTYMLTMSQAVCDISDPTNASELVFEPFDEMENLDITQLVNVSKPTILIQTFKSADNSLSLQKTLEELQPNFIIMYHSDITAIRHIELYEARRKKEQPLKVYFLIHTATVEEQSYLTTLRREKEAFEHLIQTKSTMAIPDDQDGKSSDCLTLQRELKSPVKNTRHGGRAEISEVKHVVIVDMREFRSELPALIHKRGMEIEPVTIKVGDYILTDEICIERKSLSDLVGSLNSGRLYQQCTQMSRYYTKPMLLIEFDQNKAFSWQSNYMVSSDSNNFDIQQKLLLLTLHFPKLKIIWSPSPYATAQLFEELKEGKEQPNVQYAAAIGCEEDLDVIEAKYNTNVYDFVQKLPGVTSKNIDSLLRNTRNMDAVIGCNEEQLKELLGNSADTRALYSILHEEHLPVDVVETKSKGRLRNKFKFTTK